MKNITVIGCGTMGNGIAHCFAQHGYKVSLMDVSEPALQKAMATIEKNLDKQVKKESISEQTKLDTLKNISTYTNLKEAVSSADLVVEAASENVDIKLNIFKELDALCPAHTLLASNTSSISLSKIASVTKREDKVIGMHFMNPVPLMKLVEVINGKLTTKETTAAIVDISKKLNKIPVVVNDFPGFIANRILMPMINEAIYSLHEGVSGVAEIDAIMKLGMAHPMGPLQLADFIGLDVCLSIINVLHEGFNDAKYTPCPLLVEMVKKGQLGVKSGEGFYQYSAGNKELVVAKAFQ
ncbi:MAG: 3-hydroxyacyl-CoA dehydrogenase NAD-binding domain-containing protein [Bacteroidetes bacterium]|nr:3-hydroxyacyl-CoA dehydrogenase NAD-binding domain-containing protein [Bacteroidota bacterium]